MRKTLISAILVPLLAVQTVDAQPLRDETTAVADVQVTASAAAPVPEVGLGAPLLSVEALEGIACQTRNMAVEVFKQSNGVRGKGESWATRGFGQRDEDAKEMWGLEYHILANSALRASRLTQVAEQVRREAGAGLRTAKAVEEAELARQEAVRALQLRTRYLWARLNFPATWLYHPAMGVDTTDQSWKGGVEASLREAELGPNIMFALEGLKIPEADKEAAIENVASRMITERGDPVLLVTGTLRNIRSSRVRAPDLLVTVFDRFDRVVDVVSIESNHARIRAGRFINFAYRLDRPPAYAHRVRVSFAAEGVLTPRDYARHACAAAGERAVSGPRRELPVRSLRPAARPEPLPPSFMR